MNEDRLVGVEIDDRGLPAPTPETEQERQVALFDLLERNRFRPIRGEGSPPGPYRLTLGVRERRLTFSLTDAAGEPAGRFSVSLAPFEQVVKDYYGICDSYFDAVRRLPPAEIEALEEGRRAIHGIGAELTRERLKGKAEIDLATARRLFTLVCVAGFPR